MNADTLDIRPWPDPVIDTVGHDPRSHYVEEFWLGILGPSTTWLLRRMASGLEAHPSGFTMTLADTATALGLGVLGPHALGPAEVRDARVRRDTRPRQHDDSLRPADQLPGPVQRLHAGRG